MSSIFISVCIITYNSQNTVLDTLESLKRQTFKDFELIVSDDSSTDDTRSVVQRWLDANGGLFLAYKLVCTPQNLGIAGNLNCAVAACSGTYIKPLAGDDIFTDDSIERYVNYLRENNSDAVLAKTIVFRHDWLKHLENPDLRWKFKINTQSQEWKYNFFRLSYEEQFKTLLKKTPWHTIGICLKKEAIEAVGGYDSNYYIEDLPFLIRFMKKGYSIDFIDQYLVYYRISDFSITGTHRAKRSEIYDTVKLNNQMKMVREVIYPELERLGSNTDIKAWEKYFKKCNLIIKVFNNNGVVFNKIRNIRGFIVDAVKHNTWIKVLNAYLMRCFSNANKKYS